MQIFKVYYDSPLGAIILHSDGENLIKLDFATNLSCVDSRIDFCVDSKDLDFMPIFTQTKEWLDLYFSREIPCFSPQIAFPSNASAFALRVWEIVQGIPYGATMTYGMIARQVAGEFGIAKMSAQAVGNAVGRNPIAIIVPCHRVLGANGNLTGYANGIDKKIALLQIEGNDRNRFKMPK